MMALSITGEDLDAKSQRLHAHIEVPGVERQFRRLWQPRLSLWEYQQRVNMAISAVI